MILADVKETSNQNFKIYQISSIEGFAEFIKKQRAENSAEENKLYANWRGRPYMYSIFTTQNTKLANDRYNGLTWTKS